LHQVKKSLAVKAKMPCSKVKKALQQVKKLAATLKVITGKEEQK